MNDERRLNNLAIGERHEKCFSPASCYRNGIRCLRSVKVEKILLPTDKNKFFLQK